MCSREDVLMDYCCARDHFKYQDKFIYSQKTICGDLKKMIYKHCCTQFDSHDSTIFDQYISFKSC